ncbi:MAG: dipicolinate synthase subunit B [Candidatus Improbicoccus pseudotrichonymphae]|uniref:Dipicolinate synthase subunit B n=1 Tax=Candidatus Improbicoccus pseudotrichonymphae TaxID=3033792 RepID=A0AA48KZG7_9FIRM|nr:MAG: dipicolinate synthase subunit B [Candidatus Improbicoccus pseudotrichonymphae]
MKKLNLGYAMCASFCTISNSLEALKSISNKYNILPILSENLMKYDTRFGKAVDIRKKIEHITQRKSLLAIPEAEPIGPTNMTDIMIIAPCTGNTLAKINNAITDTVVTMAVKSHLRVTKSLVICFASNDALGFSFENIIRSMNMKNIFFVPMLQDSPKNKPNSLVADFNMIDETIEAALEGRQIRPIFKVTAA